MKTNSGFLKFKKIIQYRLVLMEREKKKKLKKEKME